MRKFGLLFLGLLILGGCDSSLSKAEKAALNRPATSKQDPNAFDGRINLPILNSNNKAVVLLFGSPYCASCEAMKGFYTKLADEFSPKATIMYINLNSEPRHMVDFPIDVMPALFFYGANGKPLKIGEFEEKIGLKSVKFKNQEFTQFVGYLSKENFTKILDHALKQL